MFLYIQSLLSMRVQENSLGNRLSFSESDSVCLQLDSSLLNPNTPGQPGREPVAHKPWSQDQSPVILEYILTMLSSVSLLATSTVLEEMVPRYFSSSVLMLRTMDMGVTTSTIGGMCPPFIIKLEWERVEELAERNRKLRVRPHLVIVRSKLP